MTYTFYLPDADAPLIPRALTVAHAREESLSAAITAFLRKYVSKGEIVAANRRKK